MTLPNTVALQYIIYDSFIKIENINAFEQTNYGTWYDMYQGNKNYTALSWILNYCYFYYQFILPHFVPFLLPFRVERFLIICTLNSSRIHVLNQISHNMKNTLRLLFNQIKNIVATLLKFGQNIHKLPSL